MVSPNVLARYGIEVTRIVTLKFFHGKSLNAEILCQEPGEMVLTFPGSFHCGGNMGFDVAEVRIGC